MGLPFTYLNQPHVGEMIENHLKEKGILRAELARKIGMPQSNLTRLLKKSSIDTGKLVEISRAIEYNFFKEFCRDTEYVNAYLKDEDFYISEVNIGALIDKKMKEHGITQKELADKLNQANQMLNIKQQNVSIIIKKNTIDTDLLCFISFILQYNFFEEYYKDNRPKEIPETAESNVIPWDYTRKVQQLLFQNFDMKHKINVLRRILKKAGVTEDKITALGFSESDIRSADVNAEEYSEDLRSPLSFWEP